MRDAHLTLAPASESRYLLGTGSSTFSESARRRACAQGLEQSWTWRHNAQTFNEPGLCTMRADECSTVKAVLAEPVPKAGGQTAVQTGGGGEL
jgi:hypothetical protein